ncbi:MULTISPECIES: signal peptidase I [unclassified Bradyrhizobium]|uniref:signal peptidase I n=1 Tax=unclassified Bradyrhizobium TaxID=2631580 RepID=UPI0029164890|nr:MULTISPECIES: signal peptidase I [unclassified Bradyrhizobium]
MIWLVGLIVCFAYLAIEKVYIIARQSRWVRPAPHIGVVLEPQQMAQHDVARRYRSPFILPWMHAYAKGLLPILAAIFVVQNWLIQPFIISAESMVPNMVPGDFMIVNMFVYGLRVPLTGRRLIEIRTPRRGEIVAFHSPLAFENGKVYVKRIVGLPGDHIRYVDRALSVNGKAARVRETEDFFYLPLNRSYPQYLETLGDHEYRTILFPADLLSIIALRRFPHAREDACTYAGLNLECTVPPGTLFVMGDNRDLSLDSRAWGFVSDDLIVGQVVFMGSTDGSFARWGFIR